MLKVRVIPCLDVHAGRVTRGVQFGKAEAGELRNVGDPVELALRYNEQGADEMVFFDITATAHGRATMVNVIERAADECFMPLTVGGGLRSVEDMYTMLRAGADKISINSSALANPELIRAGAALREAHRGADWIASFGRWAPHHRLSHRHPWHQPNGTPTPDASRTTQAAGVLNQPLSYTRVPVASTGPGFADAARSAIGSARVRGGQRRGRWRRSPPCSRPHPLGA